MRAAIVGTGRMGRAIAWAMDKLGCKKFTLIDTDVENLIDCSQVSESVDDWNSGYRVLAIQCDEYNPDYSALSSCDIVISALPYHQNEKLARYCINQNIPYCDLGGHMSTSNSINDYAKNKGSVVMTDLGLAPGWVNILAEHGYNSSRDLPETVEMMVGGLPANPNNYLKYSCTWSHDGLINEYKDQCEVLINGFNTLAAGMSGLVDIDTSLGPMEAFYTSGGASHTIGTMQKRGVNNCHYKTIRHKGHCEVMKFLIEECGLSNEDLSGLLNKACPPADDLVIIKAKVDKWEEEKIIRCNKKFSAMQMATAFPVSVVATMIANHVGHTYRTGPLAYKDISYDIFEQNLDFLFTEANNEPESSN
jgi:saccharopine dehydrogenase-like NADP-dependent oxidoreductase